MTIRQVLSVIALLGLAACTTAEPEAPIADPNQTKLAGILAAQPEEVQARYSQRNPAETIAFVGIEPGMTVVEALPGGGWYSKILLPYIGPEGRLIGANYADELWPLFGFLSEEQLEGLKSWTTTWTETASGWSNGEVPVSAFTFSNLPEDMQGTADVVLFVRAMHNLARFDDQGPFLTDAIADAYSVLKPGGVVGVVQHHARDEMPDSWATGANGYLKKGFLVERFESAGFELVGDSDINANPKDQPTTEDIVWRLPPSYRFAREDEEMRKALDEIGESNRMTLKFRKPAA